MNTQTTTLSALIRLSAAALARDATMGDPITLLNVKAELAAANKQAVDAIAQATNADQPAGPKTYTVLLQRPDYLADNYGTDTYMLTVKADSVEEAQSAAQREVWDVDNAEDIREGCKGEGDPEDYAVLMVLAGAQDDIKVD